jgi:hypothetical protein
VRPALTAQGKMRDALRAVGLAASGAVKESPAAALAIVLASVLFLSLVLPQVSSFRLPLIGFEGHHWRQSFTYGVAWNFAHTTLDPFHPRMFVELAESNIVPMEAPLYPLVSSVLLRIGNDSVIGPRILSWLGLVATVFVLWRFLSIAHPKSVGTPHGLAERAGLLVGLGLAPMVAVDFRSIQPEPFAAGLAILSAFFFARYATTERRADVILGAAFFGLSLLSKPLALGITPALVLFAAWGDGAWKRRACLASAAIAVALVPWFAWDRWAHHMLETMLHGEWIIEIGHPPKDMLRMLLGGQFSSEALLHHLPHYATSWWLAPAIAAGIYRGIAERRWRRYAIPMLVWIVGYMMELLAVGIRLHSNAYYFILAAAPLAFFVALGLGSLVRLLDAHRSSIPTTTFRAALACLVLLPIGWAFSRSSDWSNTLEPAALGFERNRGVWSSDLGLGRLLFAFIVIVPLGPYLRPRRVPKVLGLALLVAIAALVVRPARDRHQYFRSYIAADRRAGFDDELRALRGAIDRWSDREGRVIISPGGTYREPPMVAFAYILRNGFPYREGTTRDQVEDMKKRGARLYLQTDQGEKFSHPYIAGPVLAKGAWWRLSCVGVDGCRRGDSSP